MSLRRRILTEPRVLAGMLGIVAGLVLAFCYDAEAYRTEDAYRAELAALDARAPSG